ncbi:hypothetical protein BH24ACI4_BH24ACI4_20880 [soil metagenome]
MSAISLPSRFVITSLCAAGIILAAAQHTFAEPIQITGGSMDVALVGGPISLAGEGFTFDGFVRMGISPVVDCRPCLPGDVLSLNAMWSGSDVAGNLVLNGVTFENVGSLSSQTAQVLEFWGSAGSVPALEGLTATLAAPFSFTGWFSLPVNNIDRVRVDLFGEGTASVFLSRSSTDVPFWTGTRATYQFEDTDPIPEPGTMLLVGTALGGLAVRLRRQRQRALAANR